MRKKVDKVNNLVLVILASVLVVMSVLGTTLAWFTDQKTLTGAGNAPNVNVNITKYENGSSIATNSTTSLGSGNITITPTTLGETIDKSIKVNFNGSNVDILVRVWVSIYWGSDAEMSTGEYITLNVASNWIDGLGNYLWHDSKILKANVATEIAIFDNITVTSDAKLFAQCEGKTATIQYNVEAIHATASNLDKWTTSGVNAPNIYTAKDGNGNYTILK